MNFNIFSTGRSLEMHDETETPDESFDSDTLSVIKTRYEFAAHRLSSKRVLEVGAGPGLGAKYFSALASEYVATEYSDQNVELFRENNNGIEVIKADANDLPFSDNQFDSIVALAMIYYLNVPKFIRECRRVLDQGGELIFCTSNKDIPGFIPSPHTIKYYSVPELSHTLEQAGFDVTVFGSFRRAYKSISVTVLRNLFKNLLKSCLLFFPGGSSLWQKLRNRSLGQSRRLPRDVRSISEQADVLQPIKKDEMNSDFRVVYFVAKLK